MTSQSVAAKANRPLGLITPPGSPNLAKGLKGLIEVIRDSNGTLSLLLAGHPKLKNDLRRQTIIEIFDFVFLGWIDLKTGVDAILGPLVDCVDNGPGRTLKPQLPSTRPHPPIWRCSGSNPVVPATPFNKLLFSAVF